MMNEVLQANNSLVFGPHNMDIVQLTKNKRAHQEFPISMDGWKSGMKCIKFSSIVNPKWTKHW